MYQIKAEQGKTLFQAINNAKISEINHAKFGIFQYSKLKKGCCGGKGKCGGCAIRFKSHLDNVPPLTEGQANLIMQTADIPKIEEFVLLP